MHTPFNLIMISAWHEQFGNGLLRFLDSHPQLMAYPFESTISTPTSSNILAGPNHWVPQRYSYPDFSSETTPEQAYHAMVDHELKTFLRTPHLSKFAHCGLAMREQDRTNWFTGFFSSQAFSGYRDIAQSPLLPRTRAGYVEAFFRSTFKAWTNFARTGKETTYVGYSPPILFDADKLFSDFPSAHMIHVIRNPFSGYADTKKRPFPMSLVRYASIWSHVQLAAATYDRKYPDRFHVVRYEDLVVRPRSVLDQTLGACGVNAFPMDAHIGPSFNREPLKEVFPWGTIKTATTEANLSTAHELTKDESTKVCLECNPMLEHWYDGREIHEYANLG